MSGVVSAPSVAAVERARPLRICLVGPSLDILGGQAVALARLERKLRDVPGLHVDVLHVNPRLPAPLRFLQRITYVRTIVTSIAYVWSLLRSLGRYDVVHAYSASYWSFVLAPLPAMLVARLFGKGVLLNYHSGEADDHLRRWRRTAVPAMRLAHEIIVPSGYLVDVFRAHGIACRAIHNFVDVERIPYRFRVEPRPIFLSNRNLEPLYNVACTLRAFALVQREIPEAELLVAGDGSERGKLEALAAELGLERVTFLGRISPEEMTALYDRADVYLNSPNIDNMPLSVIEAFAAGLPVVTTDAGGVPYVVRDGENGLVVPRDDHGAMATQMLHVMRNPGLAARIASTAREECLARYVWPAVRGEWGDAYHRIHAMAVGDAAPRSVLTAAR